MSTHPPRVAVLIETSTSWGKSAVKGIVERDPGFTRRDAVFFYLGEALERIQRPAEALPYYDRLLKEFETSEYLPEAQKRVEAIRAEMEKKAQ